MVAYNGNLVEWTIGTIAEHWRSDVVDDPYLVNRDDSTIYEITDSGTAVVGESTVGASEDQRSATGDLTRGNFVGVAYTDASRSISGWEYDHDLDDVISVRVEGLHEDEWGHLADDDAFRQLREEVERCLELERQWPIPPADSRDDYYRTLVFRNQTLMNPSWADKYRYDFDVGFLGRRDLPGTP